MAALDTGDPRDESALTNLRESCCRRRIAHAPVTLRPGFRQRQADPRKRSIPGPQDISDEASAMRRGGNCSRPRVWIRQRCDDRRLVQVFRPQHRPPPLRGAVQPDIARRFPGRGTIEILPAPSQATAFQVRETLTAVAPRAFKERSAGLIEKPANRRAFRCLLPSIGVTPAAPGSCAARTRPDPATVHRRQSRPVPAATSPGPATWPRRFPPPRA